eukprot:TRINITY_DN10374_c0_g2_i1.p1 TRINITY_DN10374_c0_g2~~TRINITY_DN10374_c0_g2_i1.p1  ORF type:complete len:121 (-),score=22.09 TRINITY_DN10374_c0_g2_i1:93-455(-)
MDIMQHNNDKTLIENEANIFSLEKQIEALRNQVAKLENQAQTEQKTNGRAFDKEMNELKLQFEGLKKDYFFSLVVGLKLKLFSEGQICNLNAGNLFDDAQSVHYHRWNEWVLQQHQKSLG